MEVGRVGDLRIRDGSIVRLPLVGDRLYRMAELKPFYEGKSGGLTVPPVGRQSAVRIPRPRKKRLTRAGLLMEVARKPLRIGVSASTAPE